MESDYPATWKESALWLLVFLYSQGRIFQLFADRLPTLLIVIWHVVPPALFALGHASILYRLKGMLIFAVTCLSVAGASESLSLRTGFPFGHYYFTEVMGPKIFGLPVLLVLAYLGIGYCSWVLAVLIAGGQKAIRGFKIVAIPALASFTMVAWDLSMEPDWATVDRAWIWRDSGSYFGIPMSNFFGWYLTAYLFYQIFALYCGREDLPSRPFPARYWRMPIMMYAICAVGNLLILKLPMAPPVVVDPSGHTWSTIQILLIDSLVSMALMLPICIAAWARTRVTTAPTESISETASA